MIYNIYKPPGWTSFDVVKKIRIITKEKKVGHAGTLDPFAEGVLIIGTGIDTKSLSEISNTSKSYRANLKLGESTDTFDNEGKIIAKHPIPLIDSEFIVKVLKSFIGEYRHKPPMFSAIKINGIRLYKLARQNKIVDREIIISNISKINFNNFDGERISFSVSCSKGTYIRVLGNEIACKLGTVGYLDGLTRTSVCNYNVSESTSIKEFEKQWKSIKI